jgi:Ca2+-binding EF-hand superfamily protein
VGGVQLFLDQHALISAFNALDLDGDGTITKDELKTLLGDDVSDEALDGLIKGADFHNEGVISKEDFIRAMRGTEVAGKD